MAIFLLMLFVFVLGYTAIALEHPLKVNKSASALITGMVIWTIYALSATNVLSLDFSPTWLESHKIGHDLLELVKPNVEAGHFKEIWKNSAELHEDPLHLIKHDLAHHLVEIAEILFFLLGAMTIVETIDRYQGFKVLTDKITTTNKVKLLWILSILTFFMSAALDNLTTTIVMIALLRKLIDDKKTRWFFASMIVLTANAGGAWSPIGDVTTIMLWVKENVTTIPIITRVFFPSLITTLVPLIILSFTMKGTVTRPKIREEEAITTKGEQIFLLIFGVASLMFVPFFKTLTHLPPYIGMLLGLGNIWLITEIILRRKRGKQKRELTLTRILEHVDVPTIFFFLGILMAVAALQSAGHLSILAGWLDKTTGQNVYVIDLAIGLLSSIVDNVPLVAGAMGMYPVAEAGSFAQDGIFWEFLAYTAGTGGSILIIGSAAGVAAMGMEKIDFIWYTKKISLLALIGYAAGAGVYYLQNLIF